MKIRIDGRELLIKRRVRDMIELQLQTGWKLEDLKQKVEEADAYSLPISAFFALANAGFSPVFEELLDRDPADFEQVEEPGDVARAAEEGDEPDPQISRTDSDPGGAEAADAPEA